MPTNLQIAMILIVLLLAIGAISAIHRMGKRAAHGRDNEVPPPPPGNRPDL